MGPYLGSLMKTSLPVYDLSNHDDKLEVQPDDDNTKLEDWEPDTTGRAEYCTEGEADSLHHTEPITTDSVTGDVLPADLVRKAHEEEIQFMNDWKVGDSVPTATARQRTGKPPLRGKWVDVNKQDEKNPLIRSRYVACEVNTHKDDSLFASPPLPIRSPKAVTFLDSY